MKTVKWLLLIVMLVTTLSSCSDDDQTQLIICSVDNNISCVKKHLEAGVDVNGTGKEGMSPFYASIINHNFKVADLFVEHGVNLNGEVHGKSFLELAIIEKDIKVIQYLHDNGASFKKGLPAHSAAIKSGDKKIISFFEKN